MTTNVYISYDYELLWGVWDKTSPAYVQRNVARANDAASRLIALHQDLDIPCTFAIVGAMLEDQPAGEEVIVESGRSAEEVELFSSFLRKYEGSEVSQVTRTNLQALEGDNRFEIGSHSYAHIYALESSVEELASDFARFAKRYHASFGRAAQSLVMPKNQVSPEVYELALANGFQSIRMNPPTLLYSPIKWGNLARKTIRLLRFADSFLPILEIAATNKLRDRQEGPMRVLVGQYFVRSYLSRNWLFQLHFARLKLGLRLAGIRGHSAHFWCHPHNFGAAPDRSLAQHRQLLGYLKAQEQAGKIRLLKMSDAL